MREKHTRFPRRSKFTVPRIHECLLTPRIVTFVSCAIRDNPRRGLRSARCKADDLITAVVESDGSKTAKRQGDFLDEWKRGRRG